jgi:hypothetical protein
MQLNARLARLSAAAEAKARAEAAAWDAQFETWFRETTNAWSNPSAYQQAQRNPSLRETARTNLERARYVGTIYFEEGAEVLRAVLLEHGHTDAYVTRLLTWCEQTWTAKSAHPHSPFEPAHRRIFTLDEDPPSIYMLAAAAARARREATLLDLREHAEPEAWTNGTVAANCAYLYTFSGGGDAGTAAMREWLGEAHPAIGWQGLPQRKAEEIAAALAGEVVWVREALPAEGEAVVLADLIERHLSAEDADRFLDYAGARTDAVQNLWVDITAGEGAA